MPTDKKTKSAKLKKYAGVYEKCLREQQKSTKALEKSVKRTKKNENSKVPKKSPPKKNVEESKKLPEKSPKKVEKSPKKLNAYQLFVKNESKKPKYKGLEAKERMNLISKAWKKK